MQGIDISRWQGIINWDAVKAAKQFAIIKIGGSDQGMYPDGMASRNVSEARRVGILRGFYVYLGGTHSVAEEVQHIKNLVAGIGGLKPGEFVALDWEEAHGNEVAYVAGIAKGLIDAGFPKPPIYMSLSRVRGNNWKPLVDMNCGLWVAAWGNNNAVLEPHEIALSEEWPFVMMQQYSSTGSVAGISTRVDLNVFNGNAEQFQKYGAPGTVTPSPAPVPTPTQPPAPSPAPGQGEYTVVAGDTLSGIAARYGTNWQTIYALNRDRISDPNRIFPGQKLRVPGAPASAPKPKTYEVKSGDNLSAIAARYGMSWQQLYNYGNNRAVIGGNPNIIKPGQVLQVP